MATKEIKTNNQYVRALIKGNSFNKEKRTIEITFASESPVRMYNWDIGEFDEILSCDPKSVRMERSKSGLPVFDSHYPRTAMVQLGRADNIKFENGQGSATITLGARADEAFISDLENGIISGISVGYRVYMYDGKIEKDKTPQLRATDWEPLEISFAPVQADPKSKIRGESSDSINTIINLKQEPKMTIAEIRAKASDEQKARLDAIVLIARAAQLSDEKAIELYEGEKALDLIRSENPGITPPKPNEPTIDVNQIRSEASKELKARLDSILLSTRAAKMEDGKAIEFFNSAKSIDEIRQEIIEKWVEKGPNIINNIPDVNLGKEAIEKKREAAVIGLANRIDPTVFKIEGQNEFREMSLHEIAGSLAAERGLKDFPTKMGLSKMIFEQRAHSTSDFPLLLESLADKMLRADYNFAPEFWDMIARRTSNQDFRAKNLYQVESSNGMQEIAEGGEIKYTSLVESKQTIKVKKYAEGIKFTREAFINDDLGAFSIIPSRFVLDWNTIRGDLVWSMLTAANGAGVTMDDNKALFHADHANSISGATTDLSDAGLEAALLKFRAQTALDGKRKIRVSPSMLIVPPALEITAKKLLTVITPNETAKVNVWNNAFQLIVEPRLTAAKVWYLAANPNSIEGLYYSYLQGNEGLRSNRVDDFDSDSLKFAVRSEFGVAAIDYRGWVKSKGEA